MKNILLPTDFSENASKAFLYALKIANIYEATLYVLHSFQPPVLSFSHAGQPSALDDVYTEISLSKFDFYKKRVPELHQMADEQGLRYDNVIFVFEEGTVIDSIRQVINRENIDLVVMGTLGASGLGQKIIGTNTVSVIENCKVPVLCIPEKAPIVDIKKIAFTTLFRNRDRAALQEMVGIAQTLAAQLYCVHVFQDGNSPADVLQYSEEWRKTFHTANLEFVYLEKSKTVENTIQEFIVENGINILAVVKRNRGFFERLISTSLSNNLAFHAHTPILIFHEGA